MRTKFQTVHKTLAGGADRKTTLDKLASSLVDHVKFDVNKTASRSSDTFRDRSDRVAFSGKLQNGAMRHAREEMLNEEISFDDIMRHTANYQEDRSIKSLEMMLAKKAVDSSAKDYWEQYFGDYGKMLTREVSEIMKSKKASVGQLFHLVDYYKRNFGKEAKAVNALEDVIVEKFSGADDAKKKTAGRFVVNEYSSGYEIEDTKTGKTHWLSDGVDVFFDYDDETSIPEVGTEEFRQMWEDSFNADVETTLEAYFPEED